MKKLAIFGICLAIVLAIATPANAIKPPKGDHYTFNTVTEAGPFVDNFDGDLSQWTNITGSGVIVDDVGNNVYQHIGGLYVGAVSAVAGSGSWTDYVFEVDVKKLSGTYFNLVFRYVDQGNFYMVEGGSSGGTQIKLYKRVAGAFSQIATPADLVTTNGSWYYYVIQVEGLSIKVWADGVLLFDVIDGAHSAGKIGLGGWNSTVNFDNVLVIGKVMGLNEILVPLIGSGMLGWKEGADFLILDNDMTDDGQAWVQVPAGYYNTFDQARGKPGGELTWGNTHARLTGKPVWEQHNTELNWWTGRTGNWSFTNNGVTCYSFRLYPID